MTGTTPPLQLNDVDIQAQKLGLKFQVEDGTKKIYCAIRRKYLVIQPEELVRQLWILHLINNCKLSKNLLQVEKQIMVLNKRRRFDLLIYDTDHNPWILFEFKSFQHKLNDSTFEQISLYNQALRIPKLVISNGKEHYGANINFEDKSYKLEASLESMLNK